MEQQPGCQPGGAEIHGIPRCAGSSPPGNRLRAGRAATGPWVSGATTHLFLALVPAQVRTDNLDVTAILSVVRALRRNPSASLLAIGAMAVGIGPAAAVLAVLNGTIWNPLPFPAADRLVALQGPVTSATIDEWAGAARSFDALAGYRSKRYTLTGAGDAVSLRATVATGDLFAVLRAESAVGRGLRRADALAGSLAVVLSDECWRTTFRGDPSVAGSTVVLSGTPFLVVGVMPPGFRFPVNAERVDLYTTTTADLQTDRRPAAKGHPRDLLVVARLRPGVTVDQARSEMEAIRASDEPDAARRAARRGTLVVPLAADLAASVASPIAALSWAVAALVVIACATAAILSLIKVTMRRGEWATRLAIGATPGHLARIVLAESLLLSLVGGAAGALVAAVCTKPVVALAGPAVSAAARARFDAALWGWVAVLSVSAAVSFGLLPAIQAGATRWSLPAIAARGPGRSASTARGLLVTVEITLAVVLLATSISLLRAYSELSRIRNGFRPDGVITFRVDLSDSLYSPVRQVEFFERLRGEASGIPGVEAAAYTALPPFGDLQFTIRLDGPGDAGRRTGGGAQVNLVSSGYFRAMGIRVFQGREFTDADTSGRPPVIVISRAAADRHFPGSSPIGRALDVRLGPNAHGSLPSIVGVVEDVRTGSLSAPGEPQVYLPFAQTPMLASTTFVVRVPDSRVSGTIEGITRALRRIDPTVALVNVRPLGEFVWNAASMPRFTTVVAGLFASTAVFLAMAGVYAVAAYAALGRRREFSIRRALGASESRITALVLGHCLRWTLPGLLLGAAGSLEVGRGLESALYGVHPSPVSTLGTTLVIAAVLSFAAAWWPALLAGRDDLRGQLHSDG
jgi:putative ABC transport system permease protein